MSEQSLKTRLDAAVKLAGLPVRSGAAMPTSMGPPDGLMKRLAALTSAVGERVSEVEWDDADRLTAQLLLSDLALVAGHLRVVTKDTRDRIVASRAKLESCRDKVVAAGDGARPVSRT